MKVKYSALAVQHCAKKASNSSVLLYSSCILLNNSSAFYLSDAPKKEIYFMAVIDILTPYDAKKKAAHAAKTVKHGVRVQYVINTVLVLN